MTDKMDEAFSLPPPGGRRGGVKPGVSLSIGMLKTLAAKEFYMFEWLLTAV